MSYSQRRASTTEGFGLAAILGLVLLGLSYLRIHGDVGSALFHSTIIDVVLSQPILNTALGHNLIVFLVAQMFVHTCFGLLALLFAKLSRLAWPHTNSSQRQLLLFWFVLLSLWLLIANAALFPRSSLGEPYADIAMRSWNGVNLFHFATTLILAIMIWTLAAALIKSRRRVSVAHWKAMFALLLIAIIGASASLATPSVTRIGHSEGKPNIIILGVDSLRTDAVNSRPGDGGTPSIAAFLNESQVFADAVTPLARTFPAWVSIITGRHPHTTKAVVNLLPRSAIHTGKTLPETLAESGYRTVYAIDEVRFSNLDQSYGFHQVIAPPMGATDFILGFFADTPLSNLLVNTRLGQLLFPYTYANRAAAVTYEPDSFVDKLDRQLQITGPTFLAVHLTLAHWPYTWASSRKSLESGSTTPEQLYGQAITRVDQQFSRVLSVLRSKGALDNAIVVVLSDHGESLGEHEATIAGTSGDRGWAFNSGEIIGHGTSVFLPHQYRVVLAFRSFGKTPLTTFGGGVVHQTKASLEDVTPTILDALALGEREPFDGLSLLPALKGNPGADVVFADRIRFTETEFNPKGFEIGAAISQSAISDVATFYQVDPLTDRIRIRPEHLGEILENRQYAAFLNGSMVAAVPLAGEDQHHFVWAQEGKPLQWLKQSDSDNNPIAAKLSASLRERYNLPK